MARPHYVYRGRRKYHKILLAAAIIAAALLLLSVWLFGHMQRYIVFDAEGLHLEVPYLSENEESAEGEAAEEEFDEALTVAPAVDADIVVDDPDYSDLDVSAGRNLTPMHALYVAGTDITSGNLLGYGGTLSASGMNAMVLQLKTADGFFHYRSAVGMASAYEVNGTEDITEAVSSLKEDDVYLTAEICTLLDEAMSVRNYPIALMNTEGEVIQEDGQGVWLDPYNETTRNYIAQIIQELAVMGFDEVVLTGIVAPQGKEVIYSLPMSAPPTPSAAVSSFALYLSEVAAEAGIRCSVWIRSDALRSGSSSLAGQDLDLFFKIFDRVYFSTEAAQCQGDLNLLSSHTTDSVNVRTCPVVSGFTPDTDSWTIIVSNTN